MGYLAIIIVIVSVIVFFLVVNFLIKVPTQLERIADSIEELSKTRKGEL